MKRRQFIQTSTALLAAQAAIAEVMRGAESKAAPGIASRAGRPRLYFNTEAVARLRRRIEVEAGFKQRWSKLLEHAETLVRAELVTEAASRQPGPGRGVKRLSYPLSSGQLTGMGMTLGLAYHVTGEARYAKKLQQALLHYAGYEIWSSPAFNTPDSRRNSGLDTAAFCVGAAAGYDALHDFLPVGERERIAGVIVRLGILPTLEDWVLPGKRIHALDSMGHNYFSVCPAGAGIAALALVGDDPRAPEWVDRVARGLELWFGYQGNVLQNKPANFDPAGGYYEGVGYADFALSEYLLFRLALANVLPNRRQPRLLALEKAGEFFAHTLYPTARSFFAVNFGDSSLDKNAAKTVRLLQPAGFGSDVSRWYLRRMDPDSAHPLSLLHPPDGPASVSALPTSVIYPENGWALLRNSWENDATLLAVKSGFFWNHAHADAGSFILFHAGQPLIIDSGSCGNGRKEYRGYYTQSRAHNVILFNGLGQPEEDFIRGSKFPGRVHSLLDGHGVQYVYADATGPMARFFSRNYRHWLWLEGVILIFDDVLAHEAGTLDWLLHYDGQAERNGAEIKVAKGQARVTVRMLHPEDATIREEQGLADQDPDRKIPYLAFTPAKPSREQKFITAIIPHAEGRSEPLPKLELLHGENALGVRIHGVKHVTEAWLNLQADGRRMHVNSDNVIAGWATDAYLMVLTRPASAASATPQTVTRYLVSSASYLHHGDQVVLDSLSKVQAVFQPGDRMEVLLNGQDRIEASVFSPRKPATLLVNGKAAPFEHQPKERTIRFRAGAWSRFNPAL
ncbi:MAG: heparinase II/III domain-containing protein [Gammaproteobacteria bacterium]